MKTKSKALLLTLCAVLLVAASMLGTMAYLTDNKTVTNTFTVGQVKITLDEAQVNGDGKPIDKDGEVVDDPADAERVKANEYKLLPGHTYTKDPTVTVKKVSESSYVRMLVNVTFDKTLTDEKLATKLDNIFTGYDVANWNRNAKNTKTEKGKTIITYEYRYKETVSAATEDNKLPALFTGIQVPGDWTNDDLAALGGIQINIVAQAIQADGFETEDAAWAAFDAQK